MPGKTQSISISDSLWDVFSKMSNDSGTPVDMLVNQAMFEHALKMGYINPVSQNIAPPVPDEIPPGARTTQSPPSAPAPSPPPQKFGAGRTKEASSRRQAKSGKRINV